MIEGCCSISSSARLPEGGGGCSSGEARAISTQVSSLLARCSFCLHAQVAQERRNWARFGAAAKEVAGDSVTVQVRAVVQVEQGESVSCLRAASGRSQGLFGAGGAAQITRPACRVAPRRWWRRSPLTACGNKRPRSRRRSRWGSSCAASTRPGCCRGRSRAMCSLLEPTLTTTPCRWPWRAVRCPAAQQSLDFQAAMQTNDKQAVSGSIKDMLYKKRMERELLRAKGLLKEAEKPPEEVREEEQPSSSCTSSRLGRRGRGARGARRPAPYSCSRRPWRCCACRSRARATRSEQWWERAVCAFAHGLCWRCAGRPARVWSPGPLAAAAGRRQAGQLRASQRAQPGGGRAHGGVGARRRRHGRAAARRQLCARDQPVGGRDRGRPPGAQEQEEGRGGLLEEGRHLGRGGGVQAARRACAEESARASPACAFVPVCCGRPPGVCRSCSSRLAT